MLDKNSLFEKVLTGLYNSPLSEQVKRSTEEIFHSQESEITSRLGKIRYMAAEREPYITTTNFIMKGIIGHLQEQGISQQEFDHTYKAIYTAIGGREELSLPSVR